MTNYTNVSDQIIPNMTGTIGSGMENMIGDPLLIGIFGFIIIVVLGYTMRVDLDTKILSGLTMIFILAGAYLPEWFFWVTLIPIGIYGGIVFSRLIHK